MIHMADWMVSAGWLDGSRGVAGKLSALGQLRELNRRRLQGFGVSVAGCHGVSRGVTGRHGVSRSRGVAGCRGVSRRELPAVGPLRELSGRELQRRGGQGVSQGGAVGPWVR
jgi:hypothetical protein